MSLMRGASVMLVRRMIDRGVSWEEFFTLSSSDLFVRMLVNSQALPSGAVRSQAVAEAQNRLRLLRPGQRVFGLGDKGYPRRLAECPDAPPVIFVEGDANLDAPMMMSVVGTRRCNEVGHACVEKILRDLEEKGIRPTVVSGLAYGIDTAAHEGAMRHGMPTVAVMAHGLDTVYPAANARLARDIIKAGGAIVTEYPPLSRPYRQRFLERNRIIAGLCDLTLVVQSDVRGGAMSTARCSQEYNRETGAVPGRFNDELHLGCHRLIRTNRAALMASADDICETMNWKSAETVEAKPTGNLFAALEGDTKILYNMLKAAPDPVGLDVLQLKTGLKVHELLSLLGEMEFDGLVTNLPGNRFTAVK